MLIVCADGSFCVASISALHVVVFLGFDAFGIMHFVFSLTILNFLSQCLAWLPRVMYIAH